MAHLRGRERARYVNRMFDRIAGRYDLLNTLMSGGRHYAWRRKAVDAVVGEMAGPALDVATGTGDFLFDLLAKQQVTCAVGLDFSPGMLAMARSKAASRAQSGRVALVAADAHGLPFENEKFVCVTVGFGVRNFVELPRALSEMWRVLKPGGRLAVLEIVRSESRGPWGRLFPFLFRRVTPWLGAAVGGNREAYTYLPESVQGFMTSRELAGMMRDAGFAEVRARKLGLGTVAICVGKK